MKSSLVPGICGLALTAMVAVGAHHWWGVHQLVAAWQADHPAAPSPGESSVGPSLATSPKDSTQDALQRMLDEMKALKQENKNLHDQMEDTNRRLTAAKQSGREVTPANILPTPQKTVASAPVPSPAVSPPLNANSAPAKEFFQGMLEELRSLKQENKDLRDQVAETNRDLMEVQFRLDTHSQEFRPLKLRNDDSNGDPTSYGTTPERHREPDSGVLPPRAVVPGLELPQ